MPIPISGPTTVRPLVRDRVRDRLREAILDTTLLPGERLRDDELVAWLGVSRTPIREAVNELCAEGLLSVMPNRSTRVIVPTPGDVPAVRATLGILFSQMVVTIVPVLDESTRRAIAADLDEQCERIIRGDLARVIAEAPTSYLEWIRLCPNRQLADVAHSVSSGLTYRLRAAGEPSPSGGARVLAAMQNMRSAVMRGDGPAAGAAMRALHDADLRTPTA